MPNELKPRCIRHCGLLEPVVGCDGCLIVQLKSDIGDLQSELKKTKGELKFASDEHGKANAECEQLREKVQNLQQESMLSRTAANDAGLDLQRANEDRDGLRIRLGAAESALADMKQLRYKAEHAVLFQDEKMRRLERKVAEALEALRVSPTIRSHITAERILTGLPELPWPTKKNRLRNGRWERRGNLWWNPAGFWICVHEHGDVEIQHDTSDTYAIVSVSAIDRILRRTGDKGSEEKVPMTTETKEYSPVEQAAVDFILVMSKRNEEPAEFIASHRILHLSCKQFDAWIALKRAVEEKSLGAEDQAGMKMLVALQKVLGITESPEGALARWRQMPEPQKEEVWRMYQSINKK